MYIPNKTLIYSHNGSTTTEIEHITVIYLPTLQDLLNSILADKEEPSFICDDPYSVVTLEDDDDNESDDEFTITCGSQVERLEIDKLIDLINSKLLAHFATTAPVPLT